MLLHLRWRAHCHWSIHRSKQQNRVNVPYADFYYGELNNVEENAALNLNAEDKAKAAGLRKDGYLDAVSSATASKWKENFKEITYSKEKEDTGGYILGIRDCSVAIPKTLYDNVTTLTDDQKKERRAKIH